MGIDAGGKVDPRMRRLSKESFCDIEITAMIG
jgi:hypothetical protein